MKNSFLLLQHESFLGSRKKDKFTNFSTQKTPQKTPKNQASEKTHIFVSGWPFGDYFQKIRFRSCDIEYFFVYTCP